MTGSHALGIDIGTSGVRGVVMGPDGEVTAEAGARMEAFGASRRAPQIWQAALEKVLADLRAEGALTAVGAVSVDGTSGTVLALDAAGAPIGEALMYNDAVDNPAIVDMIKRAAPRESAAHGAASALARAIVLQDRPGTARIVHQADWIAGLLAGAPVPSDESNALKTGYDPVARTWPAWLAQTPLRLQLLPEVVPAGTRSGTVYGGHGIPAGAMLIAGVTDGCASFLATGASRPGDAVTALGTTLTLKLLCEQPVFAPEYGIYSHRIGDMWLAGGASNTGGGVLAHFFSGEALDSLSARIDPAIPSGLDYYPLLKLGERFPVSDPDLAPRLSPRPADDALFLKGMLEAMARIEADGYRRLVEHGAPALRSVRTVGGGAGNAVWRALRFAALRMDEAPARSDQAAAGVARLALAGLQP